MAFGQSDFIPSTIPLPAVQEARETWPQGNSRTPKDPHFFQTKWGAFGFSISSYAYSCRHAIKFVMALLMCGLLCSCYSEDNTVSDVEVRRKLREFANNKESAMSFLDVFGYKWDKVCIQYPYQTRNQISDKIGIQVSWFEFEYLEDGKLAFLVISGNKVVSKVVISTLSTIGYAASDQRYVDRCITKDNPWVYGVIDDGIKSFLIRGK